MRDGGGLTGSQQLSLFLCGVDKFLPLHRYSVDMFHILVFQGYWVLMESRISLKPVIEDVRIVALSIRSHEQTQ